MPHKFIATLLVAALCVTAIGTAPARADQDALRALAVIAGAVVVGKVIHDQNKRRINDRAVTKDSFQQQGFRREGERYKPRHVQRGFGVQPQRKRVNRHLLPGDCLRSVETRSGLLRYFSQRCLERNYQHANRLPRGCAVRLRSYDGTRAGYDARCLRNQGYELARR